MAGLTQDTLLDYFQTRLNVDVSGIEPETLLFSTGLVDSFSMVDLIMFIETSCETRMKPSDVNLNNLDSIARIIGYVDRINGPQ